MTKYKWAKGAYSFGGVKAEDAAEALAEIESYTLVTAESVVDAAKDPENPLHPAFEWDDAKAAHEHRKMQARTLIRAIVEVRDDKQEIRTFILAQDEEGDVSYFRTHYVVQHKDLLTDALMRLRSDFDGIRNSIDSVMALATGNTKRRVSRAAKHVAKASEAVAYA
jgi:hypothetical protein